MADIIAIPDISKLQSAESAEALLQSEEIGERLARMVTVGKRIDHRNRRIFSESINRFLCEGPRDYSLNPAREILCHVGNRFALAELCFGVVEKHRRATEAGDADFECNAGTQRRLFEN